MENVWSTWTVMPHELCRGNEPPHGKRSLWWKVKTGRIAPSYRVSARHSDFRVISTGNHHRRGRLARRRMRDGWERVTAHGCDSEALWEQMGICCVPRGTQTQLWSRLEGPQEEGGGRGPGKPTAASHWCSVETNTVLQSNYPSIKNKQHFFFKKETIWGENIGCIVSRLIPSNPLTMEGRDDRERHPGERVMRKRILLCSPPSFTHCSWNDLGVHHQDL